MGETYTEFEWYVLYYDNDGIAMEDYLMTDTDDPSLALQRVLEQIIEREELGQGRPVRFKDIHIVTFTPNW